MNWRKARGVGLVTIVAILIWAFAEAESLRATDVVMDVTFEAETAGRRVVDLADPDPTAAEGRPAGSPALVRATLQVEGSAASVDAAVRRARRGPVRIAPGMPGLSAAPGTHQVRLREALLAHPDVRALGVDIKKSDPEIVRVTVDEITTRDLRVVARTPEGVEGLPEVKPSLVKVSLPSRVASLLPSDAVAFVRVDDRTFAALAPGRKETVGGLRVQLPAEVAGAAHVRIDPPTAEVSLTVGTRQASVRLPSVPVHLRIAPAELAKFDVEIPESDRALLDVTVTGPVELIRQIEDKTLPVVGFVPLSFEELERLISSKDAVFNGLPTPLKFEVANRTVRLKITRRPAPSAAVMDPG
jgi:hypothetical protein